jgi:hypothetical protein
MRQAEPAAQAGEQPEAARDAGAPQDGSVVAEKPAYESQMAVLQSLSDKAITPDEAESLLRSMGV